jgi:hypothetical protein
MADGRPLAIDWQDGAALGAACRAERNLELRLRLQAF